MAQTLDLLVGVQILPGEKGLAVSAFMGKAGTVLRYPPPELSSGVIRLIRPLRLSVRT
ncbi:MAG: hypothetical protein LBP76_10300 [Treponema sp.]|nr:hypothetical protein [Treponema sp.]